MRSPMRCSCSTEGVTAIVRPSMLEFPLAGRHVCWVRLHLQRGQQVHTMQDTDKPITITRTGEPPLRFTGAEIGSGEVEVGTGRRVRVRIYKTKGGKYVASVDSITRWQGEHDTTSAKSFVTPEEVVEWLRSDNDGRLGLASQEACEEAAKNDEAFGKAFVEEVD